MPAERAEPPRISVVIRCHNEERHIGDLLEALARQTLRPVEVVVVDSGSTDGTLAVVARHPVRLVQIPPEEFTALAYGRQVGNEVTRFSEHQLFAQQFPSVSNGDQRSPFCNNANAAVRRTRWEEHRFIVHGILVDVRAALRAHRFWRGLRGAVMFRVMQYGGTFAGMHYRSPVTHALMMRFYYPGQRITGEG